MPFPNLSRNLRPEVATFLVPFKEQLRRVKQTKGSRLNIISCTLVNQLAMEVDPEGGIVRRHSNLGDVFSSSSLVDNAVLAKTNGTITYSQAPLALVHGGKRRGSADGWADRKKLGESGFGVMVSYF
jgi:hypothetical protein